MSNILNPPAHGSTRAEAVAAQAAAAFLNGFFPAHPELDVLEVALAELHRTLIDVDAPHRGAVVGLRSRRRDAAVENVVVAEHLVDVARSGLAVKNGLTLSNGVGVIDSDYRGEISVGLVNLSDKPYTVQNGERIAQLAVMPVALPDMLEVETLTDTERGTGGFGSTGRQ